MAFCGPVPPLPSPGCVKQAQVGGEEAFHAWRPLELVIVHCSRLMLAPVPAVDWSENESAPSTWTGFGETEKAALGTGVCTVRFPLVSALPPLPLAVAVSE